MADSGTRRGRRSRQAEGGTTEDRLREARLRREERRVSQPLSSARLNADGSDAPPPRRRSVPPPETPHSSRRWVRHILLLGSLVAVTLAALYGALTVIPGETGGSVGEASETDARVVSPEVAATPAGAGPVLDLTDTEAPEPPSDPGFAPAVRQPRDTLVLRLPVPVPEGPLSAEVPPPPEVAPGPAFGDPTSLTFDRTLPEGEAPAFVERPGSRPAE